jgi:hypothetical protein
LNAVKAGAERTYKGFQKIQPILKKVKPIVSPRNTLLGFLFMSVIPASTLAAPNPVDDLPGWTGNVTVALMLASKLPTILLVWSLVANGSTLASQLQLLLLVCMCWFRFIFPKCRLGHKGVEVYGR